MASADFSVSPTSKTGDIGGSYTADITLSDCSFIAIDGITRTSGSSYISVSGSNLSLTVKDNGSTAGTRSATYRIEVRVNASGQTTVVTNSITFSYTAQASVITVTAPTMSGGDATYDKSTHTVTYSGGSSSGWSKGGTYSASAAGTYTAKAVLTNTTGYEWDDGTTADKTYSWTISKRSLTKPSLNPYSFAYTGSSQSPTENNYNSTYETRKSTSRTSATDVGRYYYYWTLDDTTNTKWADGTTSQHSDWWEITQATNTVTLTTTAASIYVGSTYIRTGSSKWGSVSYTSGDTSVATVSSSGVVTGVSAGSTTITCTSSGTTNYASASKSYTITVNAKLSQSWTLSSTSLSLSQSTTSKTSTISGSTYGTISLSSSDSTVATASRSSTTITVTAKKPGSCTITVTAAGDAEHTAIEQQISVSVSGTTPTITWTDKPTSIEYNSTNHYVHATSSSGATCTYSISDTSVANWDSGNYLKGLKPGTCRITASCAATGWYTAGSAYYTLTVTKISVTVTAPSVVSGTLTYNGSEQILASAGSLSNSAGGSFEYGLGDSSTSAPSSWSSSLPSATNFGTYYIWYKVAQTTSQSTYYSLSAGTSATYVNSKAIGTLYITIPSLTGTSKDYIPGTAQSPTELNYNTTYITRSDSSDTSATNAGTYYYFWNLNDTSNTAWNDSSHTTTQKSASWTINRISNNFSITSGSTGIVSGKSTTFSTSGVNESASITWSLSSTTYATVGSSTGTVSVSGTPAGATVTLSAVSAQTTNYLSTTKTTTLTLYSLISNPSFNNTGPMYTGSEVSADNVSYWNNWDNTTYCTMTAGSTGTNCSTTQTATFTSTNSNKYRFSGSTAAGSSTATATWKVQKVSSSWSTAPSAKSLTFNNSDQVLINAGVPNGGTAQYAVESGSYSTDLPVGKDAGLYTVTCKIIGDENHYDRSQASDTLYITISRKSITVTAPTLVSATVTYNSGQQKLANAGSLSDSNGATLEIGTGASSSSAPTSWETGDLMRQLVPSTSNYNYYIWYRVTQTTAQAKNYSVTTTTGTYVGAKELRPSPVTYKVKNFSIEAGASVVYPQVEYVSGNVYSEDVFSGHANIILFAYYHDNDWRSNPPSIYGGYQVTVVWQQSYTDNFNSNYLITFAEGTLTVTRKKLTIPTLSGSGGTYNRETHGVGIDVTENNFDSTKMEHVAASTALTGEHAGIYTVTWKIKDTGMYEWVGANGDIANKSATWAIGQAKPNAYYPTTSKPYDGTELTIAPESVTIKGVTISGSNREILTCSGLSNNTTGPGAKNSSKTMSVTAISDNGSYLADDYILPTETAIIQITKADQNWSLTSSLALSGATKTGYSTMTGTPYGAVTISPSPSDYSTYFTHGDWDTTNKRSLITAVSAGATSTLSLTVTAHGDDNYNSRSLSTTITITKSTPSISISPTSITIRYGETTSSEVTTSTSSGAPTPTLTIANTNFANFVNGKYVTGVAAGSTTITSSSDANNLWNAASNSISVTVNKADQTWTLTSSLSLSGASPTGYSTMSGTSYGTISLSATPTNYSSYFTYGNWDSTNKRSLITAVSSGGSSLTFKVTAAGNSNYNARTQSTTITISKSTPTITLSHNSVTVTYNQTTTYQVTASTSSGAPTPTLAIANTGIATFVNGTYVKGVGAGSTTYSASSSANGLWNAGSSGNKTLTVSKADQTWTIANSSITLNLPTVLWSNTISGTTYGTVTASSGNADKATISISSNNLSGRWIGGSGTVTMTVTAAGNSNYNALTRTFNLVLVKDTSHSLCRPYYWDATSNSWKLAEAYYWDASSHSWKLAVNATNEFNN